MTYDAGGSVGDQLGRERDSDWWIETVIKNLVV